MEAIRVENLGKRYRLGQLRPYATLRDTITEGIGGLFRRPNGRPPGAQHATRRHDARHIWALRNVSFAVEEGEVVGIIGRNGAGKTTLLRILSRITRPAEGKATVSGKVGSMLEVGTGFHPELTGTENVFLNGALLGMGRDEIKRKFDDIVAFAELDKFMGTPVKRYSAGMYVRLAFSVAAHLNPDILLVDEVLAVGDIEFQEKCLGKMGEVAEQGRTILFVSHNMTTIAALCHRGLVLDEGHVVKDDGIAACIDSYLTLMHQVDGSDKSHLVGGYGFLRATVRDLKNPEKTGIRLVLVPGRYAIEIDCRLPESRDTDIGFTLINQGQVPVASSSAQHSLGRIPSGDVSFRIELPVSRLPSGDYRVAGAVWDGIKEYAYSDNLLQFTVVNSDSPLDIAGSRPLGVTLLNNPWEPRSLSNEE